MSETGHSAERERNLVDAIDAARVLDMGNHVEIPHDDWIAIETAGSILYAALLAGGTQPSGWICPMCKAVNGDAVEFCSGYPDGIDGFAHLPIGKPRTLPTSEQVEALQWTRIDSPEQADYANGYNGALADVLALFAAAPIAEKGEG